jgi:hypothetical protein
MDPNPAEPPPGCLVLLLRLSAEMTTDVVTSRGETVAFAASRLFADELLEGLVNTVTAGYAVGAIDVAVLGYRAAEDGTPQLFSLLLDGDAKPRFVPLSQIAELPAEPRAGEGQPRKWVIVPACDGTACAAYALERVYQLVAVWLTGRYTSRAPVVIHCTAAAEHNEAYARAARSLQLLTTAHGSTRLLHYVFDPAPNESELARLSELSGELPANADAGKPARRALFVNDWDIIDAWDAIFSYTASEDTIAWHATDEAFNRSRAMWAQKMGNSPEQWEDAYAISEPRNAAAIADGASTGIYCSIWAKQLSERFLADRPDVRDGIAFNKWVNGLRTEWRAAINYSNLNWSKQAKVDQVGAAATLLGLEFGPASETGTREWRAFAVGDASLFWIRRGELHASFPVVAADQFGSAPLLIRSNPGFRTLSVAARGTCEPGDRFLLATDAVAARFFKSVSNGPGPQWSRFDTIEESAWRDELDSLRKANDMVNDDCTLVVLRVTGGSEDDWPATAPAVVAIVQEEAPQEEVAREEVPQEEVVTSEAAQEFVAADAGDLMIELPRDATPPQPDSESESIPPNE